MCGTYSENLRIFPETKMRAYKRPPARIPRIPVATGATSRIGSVPAKAARRPARTSTTPARSPRRSSWATWPCSTRQEAPLGCENMKVTNDEEANAYVKRSSPRRLVAIR